MKYLIILIVLLISIATSCAGRQYSYSKYLDEYVPYDCVPKAIYLMEKNSDAVAIIGKTFYGSLHCEAVKIIYLTPSSKFFIPIDGKNTIESIIPHNKDREWFTLSEVKKARWNGNHE